MSAPYTFLGVHRNMEPRKPWWEWLIEVALVLFAISFCAGLAYAMHVMVTSPDFTTKDLIIILGSQQHY
jgi:formate-dependent nitrite reductase membrane component NrfD